MKALFKSAPPLEVGFSPSNGYLVALKSMITTWWILVFSWSAAGFIVLLLGHPFIGLGQALTGLALDSGFQSLLRRKLKTAETVAPDTGVRSLGWIVLVRFTLGVTGPLAAALLTPTINAIAVLVLMQAWSICVAMIQFSYSGVLLRRALAPLIAALFIGLAPHCLQPGGLAVLSALGLLLWILRLLGQETQKLWRSWQTSIKTNAKLLTALTTARDDTVQDRERAQVAVESARIANAAKSSFLATMSHEIRTPLNGVLGMAQVMKTDDLSAAQSARLDVIRQSGEILLALLNDILDLSKIETGNLELERRRFDVGALIERTCAAFAPLASAKEIDFDVVIDPGASGMSEGDPTRVRQVLGNLIANAVKFTTTGAVRVRADRVSDRLRIRVEDTGPGIPEEKLPHLFQRFVQLDSSTTREHDGAGLGLAIAYELVSLMGGSLDVTSVLGAGAVFTASLPLAYLGEAQVGPPSDVASLDGDDLAVLVAEDNAVNQLVIRTLLEQVGVVPYVADNGLLAVEAWEVRHFDIILLDVQMPVMDGPSAARRIREREAETARSRTPILALTANVMAHQREEYIAAGMDGVVAKPIEAEKLFTAIEGLLASSGEAVPRSDA